MSISISNTLSLRLFYSKNSTLTSTSNRAEETTGKLSFADATALRSAIRQLQDYNIEDASDSELQQKLTAFGDTINLTLESGGKYSSNDTAIKNAVSTIKHLNSDYSDELKKIGITVNDNGYVSVSDSAVKNLSREKFTDFFNSDNEYLNKLYSAAKHITSRVDVRL